MNRGRPAVRAVAVCWLFLQSAAFAIAPMAMRCLHDHTSVDACAQGHHGEHAAHGQAESHAVHAHAGSHAAHGTTQRAAAHEHHSDGPRMRCLCLVSETAVEVLTLGSALLPPPLMLAPIGMAVASMPPAPSTLAADLRLDTPPPRA